MYPKMRRKGEVLAEGWGLYSKEERQNLVDEGELSSEEDSFMEGYEESDLFFEDSLMDEIEEP